MSSDFGHCCIKITINKIFNAKKQGTNWLTL